MNYAIIAAGESSRLKAEGLKTPKHLIKLDGEYLIERIIKIAYRNKAEKVFCIINENEPELKEYLTGNNFPLPVECIVKNTQSSMHSLFALAPYLLENPFCLLTTDSVFDENEFIDFINYAALQKDVDGILAVSSYFDDEKPLCVEMDSDNTIVKFSDTEEGYKWATGGIYYLSPKIFEQMDYALHNGISRLRNFLKLLVNSNYNLKGFSFSKIIDVDHVSDIIKAEEFLTNSFSKKKDKN